MKTSSYYGRKSYTLFKLLYYLSCKPVLPAYENNCEKQFHEVAE